MQALIASAVLVAAIVASDGALAQHIPSSDLPGRERERFLDQPYPPTPRIQLQDGRPAPVFTTSKSKSQNKKRRRTPERR